MKRAFVIGKMVGMPKLGQQNFEWLENKLLNHGVHVVSPLKLLVSLDTSYELDQLLLECVKEMLNCDTVILMNQAYKDCPVATGLKTIADLIKPKSLCIDKVLDGKGNFIYNHAETSIVTADSDC